MSETKVSIWVVVGLVFALVLSTISICGLVYMNNENNNRWTKQDEVNSLNLSMWDSQIEINDLVLRMFELIRNMIY